MIGWQRAFPGDPTLLVRSLPVTVFFALLVAAGSAASIVLFCGAVALAILALIARLGLGRQMPARFDAPALDAADRPLVAAALIFVLAVALPILIFPGEPARKASLLLKLAAYLTPLVLLPWLRARGPRDLLQAAFAGAAIGGALLLAPALGFALLEPTGRMEGLAGNAGPFSVTCLLGAGLAALYRGAPEVPRLRGVMLVGVAGAVLAFMLAGMRGMWPALPLCALVLMWLRRREAAEALRRFTAVEALALAATGLIVIIAVGWLVAPSVSARMAAGIAEGIDVLHHGSAPTSLGMRHAMYTAGWAAFLERPYFGYGLQNIWAAIAGMPGIPPGSGYTHLHNGPLTLAVASGVPGVAALLALFAMPLILAWRARADEGGAERMAAAAILTLAYLFAGLSNIMVFHDILDAAWIVTACTISASIRR